MALAVSVRGPHPSSISRLYLILVLGTVCSAFHVLTGEEVAVKREMPKNGQRDGERPLANGESTSMHKATQAEETCLLPYEAQVYRQLRGYQAIPALHHFEMYGGGYFLILDRVGVTLDHLRQACRGTLSLRTVAILAMELVSNPCALFCVGVSLTDLFSYLTDRPNRICTFTRDHPTRCEASQPDHGSRQSLESALHARLRTCQALHEPHDRRA